jgi:hypothetical protein
MGGNLCGAGASGNAVPPGIAYAAQKVISGIILSESPSLENALFCEHSCGLRNQALRTLAFFVRAKRSTFAPVNGCAKRGVPSAMETRPCRC